MTKKEQKKEITTKFGCDYQKSITLKYNGKILAELSITNTYNYINDGNLLSNEDGSKFANKYKECDDIQEAITFLNETEKELKEKIKEFAEKWKKIKAYAKKEKYKILNGTIEQLKNMQISSGIYTEKIILKK